MPTPDGGQSFADAMRQVADHGRITAAEFAEQSRQMAGIAGTSLAATPPWWTQFSNDPARLREFSYEPNANRLVVDNKQVYVPKSVNINTDRARNDSIEIQFDGGEVHLDVEGAINIQSLSSVSTWRARVREVSGSYSPWASNSTNMVAAEPDEPEGNCAGCAETFPVRELSFEADPYAAEINNDDTEMWLCQGCIENSSMEI